MEPPPVLAVIAAMTFAARSAAPMPPCQDSFGLARFAITIIFAAYVLSLLVADSLGGAILVTYAPDPRQLVYLVLLARSPAEAFILCRKPLNCAPVQPRHCGLTSMSLLRRAERWSGSRR
jgi:hypothetical protein